MTITYIDFDAAKAASGLRMVVVSGVPSPWGEAAKGMLHVKQLEWSAVRLDTQNAAMVDWIGEPSAPALFDGNGPAKTRWVDIILHLERLGGTPLLPDSPLDRALAIGLVHELVGEDGLCWARRLQLVHAGLSGRPGFSPGPAKYLAGKYGYKESDAESYRARTAALLAMFAALLKKQQAAGSPYLVGSALSAADIYFAASLALVAPLSQDQCALPDPLRAAFASPVGADNAAVDPILTAHRDRIYSEHLSLPLTL